jgi:GDP-L-fucose synthase
MDKKAKIYVAGHLGLVGSALVRKLNEKGYNNIIGRSFQELNLLDQAATQEFFMNEKPEYVILAAAKVGGIVANNTYRAQFIYENLQIQNNIIHSAYLSGVKKLLFLGSSCIYPNKSPQPMKEGYLLTSELEYTNEPYAIAKIAGIKMCEAYNMQYGTNYISVMPTNLFGPNDNYDLEKSHVLPALIRKMHLGKCLKNQNWDALKADLNKRPIEGISGNASENDILVILEKYGIKKVVDGDSETVSVTLWGTGSPRREFLYSEDMADACVFLMENIDFADVSKAKPVLNTHINIGTGRDLTIKELALKVKDIVGFTGELLWDSTKPDGTYQKLLDVTKLNSLGWKEKTSLEKGIKMVYDTYSEY